MTGIVVSAHGGRYSNQRPDLIVPDGYEVVFYVADGALLSNPEGHEILRSLKKGKTPKTPIVQTLKQGDSGYDYACWFASEFPNQCGIYEVGTGKLLKSLDRYTDSDPYWLSAIFRDFKPDVVYWDCCREIEQAGGGLTNSPGAYPSGIADRL